MTISSSVRTAGPFIGNGVATAFPFAFKVFQTSDVLVARTDASGVQSTLSLASDYTVVLNADQNVSPGGTVTLLVALPVAHSLNLTSNIGLLQGLSLPNQGGWFPRNIEDALDRLTILLQQLGFNGSQTLRTPEITGVPVLPTAFVRANNLLGFDSNGNPVAVIPGPSGSATTLALDLVSTNAAAKGAGQVGFAYGLGYGVGTIGRWLKDLALAAGSTFMGWIQVGAGAVLRTVSDKLRDTVSVFDFMTTAQIADVTAGTASIDVRAAVAAAVLASRGKRLIFPKGQYLINTDGGTITLEEVALEGEYVLDGATATIDQGAVLRFTGTTNSPFKIRRGVTLKGLGFYYPNQADSATPVVYPYTLDFDFTNGAVQFVYLTENVVYNAYNFCRIDDAGGAVGHVWVEDNTIYAINIGFAITYNAEVIKFIGNSFTFGHWLAATEGGCRGYTRANGVILQYPKGDGIFFVDNMCYGYLQGLLMAATGLVQLCRITSNTFDTVRYGIIASGSGNFTTSQIVGNDFYSVNPINTALQGRGVSVNTTGATPELLTIAGNTFAASTEEAVFVNQTATRAITVDGNSFNAWANAKAAGMYYAVGGTAANTTFIVTGNNFAGGSSAFQGGVGSTCSLAMLTGNRFNAMQNPISINATTVTMTGNTSLSTGGATTDQIFTAVPYSFGNTFDKPGRPAVQLPIAAVGNYANDAAAAAGSVPVGGWYRNGSVLQIRVT